MTESKSKKWNDESVATLMGIVGSVDPVSVPLVEQAATALGVSVRSIAAKLRNLDRKVDSMAKEATPTFTVEQSDDLSDFVNANPGVYTYKEIADKFPGNFTAKQIQGKLLALELTSSVRPAEKLEVATKYTPAEEEVFIGLAQAGKFIEDIAQALGKEIPSIRGKALSLVRSGLISKIPSQKESHAKNTVDPVDALGDVSTMTVAEIAAAVDKTDRGIRTLLTRRGIDCADYRGSEKKAKAEAKVAA